MLVINGFRERRKKGCQGRGKWVARWKLFSWERWEKKRRIIICNARLINRQEFIKLSARRGDWCFPDGGNTARAVSDRAALLPLHRIQQIELGYEDVERGFFASIASSVTSKITRGKGCLIFRPFTLALEPNNMSSKPYMFFQGAFSCPLFVFFLSFISSSFLFIIHRVSLYP